MSKHDCLETSCYMLRAVIVPTDNFAAGVFGEKKRCDMGWCELANFNTIEWSSPSQKLHEKTVESLNK